MRIVQTQLGDAEVLTLTGRLDAEAAPELELHCDAFAAADTPTTLVINVGTLDYLSSAGLRTLLAAGRKLQEGGGKLVLVAASGPVRQLVELAGIHKVFPLCATVEEAAHPPPPGFRIEHTSQWGGEVLEVTGRVDAESAPELEKAGRGILVKDHMKLVIHLGGVEYLSSAGLCALLNLAKHAKSIQGRLLLSGPSPSVRRILNVSGFDKLFPIRDELSEALTD